MPVFYFPKFFHPDPTVNRRSGFLQPQFNSSKALGDSLNMPYFKTLGINRDYTFKPTIFDDLEKIILQNEFRQENEHSSFIADFALLNGYKSSTNNKKKNINHLFLDFKKDLNLSNYSKSNLDLKIERVNNDTYLKVFQNNLFNSPVMPSNTSSMHSKLKFDFENDNFNLSAGFDVYEELGTKQSDRYQYVFPSYDFSKNINIENLTGSLTLNSSGSNNLKNTNNLKSTVINNLSYNSVDYFTKRGFKNNFNLYFKNLNVVAKNDPTYNSSLSIDGMNIFEVQTSLPLIKENKYNQETLTPKISLRINPWNNMTNNSSSTREVTANNIFDINRLGLSDTFEAGKSITLGLDYKLDIKNQNDFNNNNSDEKDRFVEFKLATVIRDTFEDKLPTSSTIDKKNSNLFGSITNNIYKNLELGYNFSVDNDLKTFESHGLNSEISINNFVTNFEYVEQRNEVGSSHILSNKTSYNFDKNNSFSFSTRRNKSISLTEYYDLSYEYKNDCLIAGFKYNKTFYKDNDLVPSENLFFTISLIPLTTYERIVYENN